MQCARSLFDHLTTLQHPISEDDLVDTILKGLDIPYEALVRVVNTTQQFLSFDDLFSFLLSEEMHLKPIITPALVEDSSSALYSSRGQPYFLGRGCARGSFWDRGYGCGKFSYHNPLANHQQQSYSCYPTSSPSSVHQAPHSPTYFNY